MEALKSLGLEIHSLSIFRKIAEDEVISSLIRLIDVCGGSEREEVESFARFTNALYREGADFAVYIYSVMLEDENSYILKTAHGIPVTECETDCLMRELSILQSLSRLSYGEVRAAMKYRGELGRWTNSDIDLAAEYEKRLRGISVYGYGIYAKYGTFILKEGRITPVKNPDPTTLSALSGYRRERQLVIDNTLALLEGKPAANVLLYGDAGTGKSSTVKAVANEFRDKGLRLIELKKNQLHEMPALLDSLGSNPLKFILFIDDLSFAGDDDDFGALKAILEGSVSSKTPNLVIYATSNRRHLVKESFSARDGDDIHHNDTIEEMISLSARFGLTITFQRPGKNDFVDIVKDLARWSDVDMPEEELILQAEAFALRKGGRSPRVARQFIDSLKSMA